MRLCGIGCKDYILISTDVNVLPDLLKLASTDSLVIPSSAPDGMGFPISHVGSAFLTLWSSTSGHIGTHFILRQGKPIPRGRSIGKPIPSGALDGITRESVESQLAKSGNTLVKNIFGQYIGYKDIIHTPYSAETPLRNARVQGRRGCHR